MRQQPFPPTVWLAGNALFGAWTLVSAHQGTLGRIACDPQEALLPSMDDVEVFAVLA